jgi:hypothetical protein
MLEHHEEEALAEIEAHLHADDPYLSESLDAGVPIIRVHPLVRTLTVLVVACLFTYGATLALGPDVGGLVAVLSLSFAAMYAWQTFRVCRGLRRR